MGRREFDDTGLAFTQIVKDCRFLAGVDWRSPQYFTLRLGPFQPGLDALADHCPLELGEDTHHLEQRLARRGRGVHALLLKTPSDTRRHEGVRSRQSPKSLLRMAPPLAQNTSATPISEPPATTPDATGKVNSSATFGSRLSTRSATRAPRKNKSP
jgi:hypothetical protein